MPNPEAGGPKPMQGQAVAALSYEVDGRILILRVSAIPSTEDRRTVFGAIQADPAVADESLVLIDTHNLPPAAEEAYPEQRVERLVVGLGRKLGQLCALIVPADRLRESRGFQLAGFEAGVRVASFGTEQEARRWLLSSS